MTLKRRIMLLALVGGSLTLAGCATNSLQQRYNPNSFTAEGTVISTTHQAGYYTREPTVIGGRLLMNEVYHPAQWQVHARTNQGTIVACDVDVQVYEQVYRGSTITLTLKQESAAHDFTCLAAKLPL